MRAVLGLILRVVTDGVVLFVIVSGGEEPVGVSAEIRGRERTITRSRSEGTRSEIQIFEQRG
jgi:hypothetical protein